MRYSSLLMSASPKLDAWIAARIRPEQKRILEGVAHRRGVEVGEVVREALQAFMTEANRLQVLASLAACRGPGNACKRNRPRKSRGKSSEIRTQRPLRKSA